MEFAEISGEERRNELFDEIRRDTLRQDLYKAMQKGERLDAVTTVPMSGQSYVCSEQEGMWKRACKAIQGLGGSVYEAGAWLIFDTHLDRTGSHDNEGATFKLDTNLQNIDNFENLAVGEEIDDDDDEGGDVLAGLLSEWTNLPPQTESLKGLGNEE